MRASTVDQSNLRSHPEWASTVRIGDGEIRDSQIARCQVIVTGCDMPDSQVCQEVTDMGRILDSIWLPEFARSMS